MDYFTQARINMVKNQIMPNKVNDSRILDIISELPRHEFIPGEWQKVAYIDGRLPLGEGRTILQPDIFARMVQALKLNGDEKILDIACGTGYSSSVLANLCSHVVGVENINSLAVIASNLITKLGYKNIDIKTAELLTGANEQAPFDVIFINGTITTYPSSLLSQLKNNGKLICIEKISTNLQKAVMYQNFDGSFARTEIFDAYGDLL
jgi:protein-L-isoaspartate(D-aspartate) O-methyltransferase